MMNDLQAYYPGLARNFADSVFAACTFNFGPQALTFMHQDHGNRAVGFCPILAAGTFDYRRGGHLLLKQYRVALEFPPGCIVGITSASVAHGNVKIASHETRVSFTQYSAGGLFRFVEYGFQTWKQLTGGDKRVEKALKDKHAERWRNELKLFSKIDELESDRRAAGIID